MPRDAASVGGDLELGGRVAELAERRADLGRERGRDQRERELVAAGIGLVDVEAAERVAIERRRDEWILPRGRERVDEHDRIRPRSRASRSPCSASWRCSSGPCGPAANVESTSSLVGHRVAGAGRGRSAEQLAEQLVVAARLAGGRRDRGRVVHPHVAVAAAELAMLEERRRRQHDVGELRGVGHHLLVDDDEQVLAAELLDERALVRRGRRRVRVVDEQALDRRLAQRRRARGRRAHWLTARATGCSAPIAVSALTVQRASLFAIVKPPPRTPNLFAIAGDREHGRDRAAAVAVALDAVAAAGSPRASSPRRARRTDRAPPDRGAPRARRARSSTRAARRRSSST